MINQSWLRNNIDVVKVRYFISTLMADDWSIAKIGTTIGITYKIVHGVARHKLIPSHVFVERLVKAFELPASTFQLFPESLAVGVLIEYAKSRGKKLPDKSKLPPGIVEICQHYKYMSLVKKVSKYYGFNVYKTERYKKSNSELLGEIKKYYLEYGEVPRCDDMLLGRTILSRFGTWNNAIELAKLKPNKVFKPRKKRERICAQ